MEMNQKDTTKNVRDQLNGLLKSPVSGETKPCLFNLIVYTQEPRRTNYFKEVVKIVMSQFPCRIIFIQGNPSSKENRLTVQVTTEKSQDERNIVCDQILIEALGQDINRVYFLLFPNLVPDLPIYLLWGQDPTTEYTILPHLEYFATRLIFDSEATENLQQFSRDMLNRLTSSSIQIIDMNWARFGGWREVLARIFDSKERLDQVTAAKSIRISYNDRPNEFFLHPDTQAIYFQAWLASRLGWQFVKAEKGNHSQILVYQDGKDTHQIELTPQSQNNFEPEEILAMEVKGNDYSCHLKRISTDQIKMEASNQFECTVPVIILLPTLTTGRNFMQEIFYQKISDHYISMLKLISLVKWK